METLNTTQSPLTPSVVDVRIKFSGDDLQKLINLKECFSCSDFNETLRIALRKQYSIEFPDKGGLN